MEAIPLSALLSRNKEMDLHMCMDSDHDGNKQNRSVIG